MSLQPIKLFMHATGPNPWKVVLVLEELEVPYVTEVVKAKDLHTPVYERFNPNGRAPTIVDPNKGGFTLWESGAIIEYLVETYDTEHRLGFTAFEERHLARQFLHFQTSGQGPYFGQAIWFMILHSEQLPSAQDRYVNEIKRVTAVLDSILKDREFLVGRKASYADLAFLPWYWVVRGLVPAILTDYPNFRAWYDGLLERPIVKKVFERNQAAQARIQGQTI